MRWRPTSATAGSSGARTGCGGWPTRAHPAVPHERRHHRRGAGDAGAARARQGAGGGRGVFRLDAHPGDTFLFAGRLLAFEGIRENEVVATLAKTGRDPKMPAYAGGQAAADHASGRSRARICWPTPRPGTGCRRRCGEWLAAQARRSELTAADELLVETFAARRPPLPGRLLLRRPQRAPDPGHAADPAHGAAGPAAAGLRRPPTTASPPGASTPIERVDDAVRCRHPGRRSRGVDGRKLADQAHLPQLRGRCGPDRAAASGPGEDRPAGHLQRRPDLRRAAQVRPRPRAAARRPRGGRDGADRHPPPADLLVSVQGRIRHVQLDRISPFAVSIIAGIGKEFVSGEELDQSLDEAVAELVAEAMAD